MTTTAIRAQKAGAKARSRIYWPALDYAEPLVQELYRLINDSPFTLAEVCRNGGLGQRTIQHWKRNSPTITLFNAALNALGYKLAIVPLDAPETPL